MPTSKTSTPKKDPKKGPKKGPKKVIAGKVRRMSTPRTDRLFSLYVYRLMKGIHPDLAFSSKAMSIINSFVVDMFGRLACEASRLMRYTRRITLMPQDIRSAVRLLVPGELGERVMLEALRAVTDTEHSKRQK